MVMLRLGKKPVMPFTSKEKAKKYAIKLKKKGHTSIGMGKSRNIYWVTGSLKPKKGR